MIRHAVSGDRFRLVALLREAHAHHGFHDPYGLTGFVVPFDPAYIERWIMQHQTQPDGLCLVSDREGVDGVLMAFAFDHPCGPVRVAKDSIWWIAKDRRGGSTALRMLDAYEDWAKQEQGCRFVGIAGMGADPDVGPLLSRRGYRAAETHFLKAI